MPVARSQFVPSLPDGRVFSLYEEQGAFTLLFVEGECSPQAAQEMVDTFQANLDRDAWTQNWTPRNRPDQAKDN